jgi:hypothetical protein
LRRAEQDLVVLDGRMGVYAESLLLRVDLEVNSDGETGEATVCVERVLDEVAPNDVVLIGHIVHDLRCALDYLAHELTALGKGRFEQSQFPIADSPANLSSRDKKTLQHLTPKHRAFVEGLQPYDGRNFEFADLRDLSNRDKHRLLVATVSTADIGDPQGIIRFLVGYNCRVLSVNYINMGALEPGTKLASYRVDRIRENAEVHMQGSWPGQVALEVSGWWPVVVLERIRAKFAKAVEEVAPDFP